MKKIKNLNLNINIIKTDITELNVDAIVTPATEYLLELIKYEDYMNIPKDKLNLDLNKLDKYPMMFVPRENFVLLRGGFIYNILKKKWRIIII